jgi:multiple sugar transport system permease protein
MKRKKLSYNVRLFILMIAATLSMLPIIFIFTNSFMGAGEARARYTSRIEAHNILGTTSEHMHYVDMTFLPTFITPSAYTEAVINEHENLRFLWNSLIITVPIVIGGLVIAPLAAYGFERARTRHKEKLYFAYIIIMLLPMQALLVPHFIAANTLGINDSYFAIILPAVFATFGVFLCRQQMKAFNKELIEAAKIDGANEFRVFLSIVIPNIKPTIVALAVLTFAEAWNIVDQAVVFIRSPFQFPMSVYLSTNLSGNIGVVFALSTIFMIPALIIFLYGQEDLSKSIGYTGDK